MCTTIAMFFCKSKNSAFQSRSRLRAGQAISALVFQNLALRLGLLFWEVLCFPPSVGGLHAVVYIIR